MHHPGTSPALDQAQPVKQRGPQQVLSERPRVTSTPAHQAVGGLPMGVVGRGVREGGQGVSIKRDSTLS